MTQQETLIAAFKALGIEPEVEAEGNAGLTWVALNAKEHIGGYRGFVVNFAFNQAGEYVPDASGIWE